MKNLNLFAGIFVIACLYFSGGATAQNMNYGALETLFEEPVTTSATGKPQRVSEVPVTMEILTADDIRRSGAVDLPEVLRQINGVSVIQKSEQFYDVSVRGYNQHASQRLLVLVNGREVYQNFFGTTLWSVIPVQLEEIRQIEVVKGPNTALFGFNAVSGVINIVTFNPLYDDQSSVGLRVGSGDFRQGHYMQTLMLSDNAGVRVSGGVKRMEGFNNPANGIATVSNIITGQSLLPSPEQHRFNVDASFRPSENSTLRLEVSAAEVRDVVILPQGIIDRTDVLFQSAKIGYDHDAGKWGLLQANIYANAMDYMPLKATVPSSSKLENRTLVMQLQDTFSITPAHTGRVQFEFRTADISSDGGPAALLARGAEVSEDIFSLSGMWNWDINSELSWTNAVRGDFLRLDHNGVFTPSNSGNTVDEYDRDVYEVSYNSGLVWKATDKDTLRLSTARGVEIPSLIEYGLDLNTGGTVNSIGDPFIQSSIITNYELAWDREVDLINGLFRSAVFYLETEDVKSASAGTVGDDIQYGNIGDSKSYGLELGLEGAYKEHYSWGIGYIFQHINDDFQNGKNGSSLVSPKDYEDNEARHKVNLELGYHKGPWEADALVYYTSSYDGIAFKPPNYTLDPVDGYVGVNARVGYTYKENLTFAVSGQQLQSSKTQTSATPDVDRRLWLGVTYKF